ncbi:guanine nucleotide-binding protein g(o) subunit alpha [Anaeramoeba flamelloides]|uniref:Guanine nucleotide-binding protein g(O) subunit alpha n=1 Tax=Anaeramoeba flamelloides TaxID=1746091 RepID=A0AAV7YIL1_9EUKA|nr:guanine nucleotide-binding protein g(o) subunit alpha [Anaeramoeba flamelloides]KAJ6245403.1 guanine nucleotide-binding protein g(o) subunit alpha [Anaeramoeba flamelloides]
MCGCSNSKDKEAQNSKKIDKKGRKLNDKNMETIRLLLLGAGESGKSTVVKQCKNLFLNGFKKKALTRMKNSISSNIIQSIQALVNIVNNLEFEYSDPDLKSAEEEILELSFEDHLTTENGQLISKLWKDPAVQKAYSKRNKFHLFDGAKHFLDNVEEIIKKDYIPSVKDILMLRVRTTGISETTFIYEGTKFCMIDVGGQRNERKKWIHCFEDVTCVIFVASLTGYDQVLVEESSTNRMKESLSLFSECCNSQWFQGNSLILFLNKLDLFEEQIKTSELQECFPDYDAGSNVNEAKKYIKDQFYQLNNNKEKNVYSFFTSAINPELMKDIFASVSDTVLQKQVQTVGFI